MNGQLGANLGGWFWIRLSVVPRGGTFARDQMDRERESARGKKMWERRQREIEIANRSGREIDSQIDREEREMGKRKR